MKLQLGASQIFCSWHFGEVLLWMLKWCWSEKIHPAICWIRLEVALEGAEFIQTSRDLGIKVCWFHFSKSSSEEWWFWGVSTSTLKAEQHHELKLACFEDFLTLFNTSLLFPFVYFSICSDGSPGEIFQRGSIPAQCNFCRSDKKSPAKCHEPCLLATWWRNTSERKPKLVSLQLDNIQVSLSTLVLRGMHFTLKLSADCNLC